MCGSSSSLQLALAEDGGVVVDREMRASLPEVYAAGDVCAVHWEPQPQLWFQVGGGGCSHSNMLAHEVHGV